VSTIEDDNDSTRGPVLSEVIRRHISAAMAEQVRSLIPARVTSYDATTQKVSVKPLINDFHRDEEGALVVEEVPVISGVPVVFLTAGGFTFTVPIDTTTTGALLFSDRSLDRWLSGDGQAAVDPEFYTRSNLADGIFIPGLLTFAAPMSSAPPTDHAMAGAIGPDDASHLKIHLRASTITIGTESGAQRMPHWETSLSALANVASDLATVGAAIGVATPHATSFVAQAALPAGANPYLSTQAKNG
jgi:hypothetical protein